MMIALFISLAVSIYLGYNVWECYQVGDKQQMWFQLALLALSLCFLYHSYELWTTPIYYYY